MQITRNKRLFQKLKLINHKQILAVIFLMTIFYVGTATLPSTIINTGNFLKEEKSDVMASIISAKDKIDNEYQNMLVFKGNYLKNKGAYINLNGLMARIMGQRYMNERVKLDNGHLSGIVGKKDITLAATQITKVYNAQKEKGKEFLFVLAPCQIPKYENIIPTGYIDYCNPNSDELLESLQKNGVPFMDLREELRKDGISNADAFYKTDHHWKLETGFWAYGKIVEHFMEIGFIDKIDQKYTDINDFNVEIYKDWFLGSSGKRTGSYFAGVDDIAFISPRFETNMSVEILTGSIRKKGSFLEVAYNMNANKLNYFNSNPYSAYGHGDRDITQYNNEYAPIDLKVMSWGDSFTNAAFTFLPLGPVDIK